jgi:HK97 family phage prohead protease
MTEQLGATTEGPTLYRAVSDYEVTGDTVEALIMPWDRPADVLDIIGDRLVEYQETFARGAFQRAEDVPTRVLFCWGHDESWGNTIGRGRSFQQSEEGEIGVFRLAGDIDKARAMLEGMGLSVSFRSIRPAPGVERDGVLTVRQAVHLRHVAVVPNPAYPETRVLAMRERRDAELAAAEERRTSDRAIAAALQTLVDTGASLPADQLAWLDEHRPLLHASQ